jgi:hypothetical protein
MRLLTYRTLRIFSLDPSVSRLEGAEATVRVPYEPLAPGPVGRIFEVDDFDSTRNTHWGRVDLDDHALLLNNGRNPSISDPLFHQQMVYAVCSTVHAAFRRALGRHVTWGFAIGAGEGARGGKLSIRPHAVEERNAFYDHGSGELRFGYFRAPQRVSGRTLPGGAVFTCLSHDIIAHEVTHALLDGLRTHFNEPRDRTSLGFTKDLPISSPPSSAHKASWGLGSNGTENRHKGLDSSNFGLKAQFSPIREVFNHQNGAVVVRHATSCNILSWSNVRIGMPVKPVFCSVAPQTPDSIGANSLANDAEPILNQASSFRGAALRCFYAVLHESYGCLAFHIR